MTRTSIPTSAPASSDQKPPDGTSATAPARVLAEVSVAIRWRDMDAYGHVNSVTYLTYVEQARINWLADVDCNWHGEHAAPVLAAARINYRNQLGWPGNIVVQLTCTRVGRSSITIAHRIVAEDDPDRVYADGDTVMVWINPETGQSVPLPEVVRERCVGSEV